LWIAGVVLLALVVLGTVMSIVNLNQLSAGIDRDLRGRAEGFNRPGPPGMGFGPGGQNGNPMRQPPQFREFNRDVDTIAAIRRPRVRFLNPPEGQREPMEEIFFDAPALEQAVRGKRLYTEATFREERIRVYSAPIIRNGQTVGAVQVAAELRPLEQLKAVEIRTMLGTVPFALIGAILVAYFLTGRVTKPIGEMGLAAQSIAQGDYSARLPALGNDEFGTLGTQFNQMATKVEESVTGLKAALEQQRQFTADASHELRTPLTRLRLATSSALDGPDSEAKQALRVADDAGKDMSKLVQQLLDLARADTGDLSRRFEPVDLRLVASEAANKVHSPVPLQLELSESAVTIRGDAYHLERVMLNLLENAIRHTEHGQIVLRVMSNPIRIEVEDTGVGIAPEHLPHLTERFYRVDAARDREAGGAGLGLAIVDEVVRAHGGRLEIESKPGVGTTVRALFE